MLKHFLQQISSKWKTPPPIKMKFPDTINHQMSEHEHFHLPRNQQGFLVHGNSEWSVIIGIGNYLRSAGISIDFGNSYPFTFGWSVQELLLGSCCWRNIFPRRKTQIKYCQVIASGNKYDAILQELLPLLQEVRSMFGNGSLCRL